MKKTQKNERKNKFMKQALFPALLILICLTIGSNTFSQDSSWIYGRWKIDNMDFVSPPATDELQQVFKDCQNRKVTITASQFIFKATGCFLLRSMRGFRITKQYILYSNDTSLNDNYAVKTIDYLFDDGKRKSILACKTNYTFESSEGDVPELEIFIIDRNHLIINQDENIMFLKKD